MKHKSADNKNQKPRTIEEATQLYLSKKKREKEIAEMSKKIAEEIAREEAAQKAADKKRAEEDEALRKEEEKKKAEEDTKKDPDEDKIEEIDPYEDNKQEDKKKESYMSGSIKKSAAAKYGSTRKRAEAGISTTSPYGLDDLEGIVHGDTLDDGDIETVIKRLLDDVGEPTLARDSMYGMAEPSMAEPSMAELSMAEPSMAELSMSEPSMKDITWGAPQLSYGPKSPEDAQVELIRELISGNNKNIFKGTNKAEMDEFIKGFIKHVNHPDYNEQDSGDSGKKDTYDWHDMSDHGGTGHEDSANAAILDWADDATKHIEDPQERRSEKARLFYQRVYGEDQEKSKQNSFDEDKKKGSNMKRFSALEKYLRKKAAVSRKIAIIDSLKKKI